jgi:helix-turn-helix, Psq domain
MASFQEQKIQQALEDLRTQKFPSVRAAAKAHGVNHVTLNRRSKGGISKQEARLAQQLLSQHQEGLLVQWILHSETGGYAQVREMAVLISTVSGGPDTLGNNWVPRFPEHHSRSTRSLVCWTPTTSDRSPSRHG